MEVGVQRTNPIQRIHANGPRVSFNRDVHVKRIGNRHSDTDNYPIHTTNLQPPQNSKPPLRRELPADLSEESILKEAALVLAQVEGIKCKAQGGSDIVGGRLNEKTRSHIQRRDTPIPNKFNSLPTRKNKTSKPVTRSVSDVSSKKTKKPSIFSVFSRKSEPNLDKLSSVDSKLSTKDNPNDKRITRSKSDAGSSREHRKSIRKRNFSENEDASVNNAKHTQLSPIIENTQREDYFAEQDSKSKILKIKEENKINLKDSTDISSSKTKTKSLVESSENVEPLKFIAVGDRGFDSLPRTKKSAWKGEQLLNIQSKSLEDMHCSQLPPEKPPLTKGLTVNGMVKRLSMERFSPPPHLSTAGFSYIRPTNEQRVIYAQVVCDNDNKARKAADFESDPQKDMEFQVNSKYKRTGSFNHRSIIERSAFPSHNQSEFKVNQPNEAFFDVQRRSVSPQLIKITETDCSGPWKQSPRNLSDEDEGLGFEPRKYFEEEIPESVTKICTHREYELSRQSPSEEPPIIPVIRSVSPIEVRLNVADRGRADGMDAKRRDPFIETHNEFNDLSYRRAALESKIRNRRLGSVEPDLRKTPDLEYRYSPEKNSEYRRETDSSPNYYREERHDYRSPIRENIPKYHKLNTDEVLHKYSPERTHLDMISPGREVKTSRYVHTKVFDDGTGGVRETYEKETTLDEHGHPHTKETRRRERLDSPRRIREGEIINYDHDPIEDRQEPKSLNSEIHELHHSSPESHKYHRRNEDNWQNSLKRDKHQQRSFDKGDSGIENDFRKESFNGELKSKWRKRTVEDDIHFCELFLKKERRHTEELYRKRYDFVYRERSIDDGSHFDPRLDKYPKGTLRKKKETDRYSSPNREETGTLKREKKKGGLEKVKQLFTGSSKKKEAREISKTKESKETNGKTTEAPKSHYMVREDEMRQRYYEYKPQIHEPMIPDIATRRRLSTPKASPLLKRTSSEKSSKPSPLSLRDETNITKAEKSGWFKSIDRRTKKNLSPKFDSPTRTPITSTEDEFSTLRVKNTNRPPIAPITPQVPEKNLRFFGDTDLESNPSFSRAASAPRSRPSVVNLNRNQKYSQSAYHLDRITKPESKSQPRSSSMQDLGDGVDEVDRPRRRQHSRSRELDDISESGSDSEFSKHPLTRQFSGTRVSSSRGGREVEPTLQEKNYYKNHGHRNSRDRDHREHREHITHEHRERSTPTHRRDPVDENRVECRKPPPGPPKPARAMDRRTIYSRERDRVHDSSGTEGESSLQSQRSVVYLHATTVGAIPQPYFLNSRRRAMSREELSALKKKEKMQPMTRTVSRSVSMLAPWKPKHLHEGYEINYSQEPTENSKKTSTVPRKTGTTSNSNKSKKMSSNSTMQRSKKCNSSRDDLSSTRPSSSLTSASKSGISSGKKSSSDIRKDTLSRRKVK